MTELHWLFVPQGMKVVFVGLMVIQVGCYTLSGIIWRDLSRGGRVNYGQ